MWSRFRSIRSLVTAPTAGLSRVAAPGVVRSCSLQLRRATMSKAHFSYLDESRVQHLLDRPAALAKLIDVMAEALTVSMWTMTSAARIGSAVCVLHSSRLPLMCGYALAYV